MSPTPPIDIMPDLGPAVVTHQAHAIELPPMCPVSGNPRAGSYVVIRYVPVGCFLEVYSLRAYVRRFVGGWLRDGRHIRDMEQVVQTIAADCAAALGVTVAVRAHLNLDAGRMTLRAVAS